MTKFMKTAALAIAVLVNVGFVGITSAFAAQTTPVTTEAVITQYNDGLDAIDSSKIKNVVFTGVYNVEDEKYAFQGAVTLEGHAQPQANSTSTDAFEAQLTILDEIAQGRKYYNRSMEVVLKDGKVYVRSKSSVFKKVKNQWIIVPADKYEAFGEALNAKSLFNSAHIAELTDREVELSEKAEALLIEKDAYVPFGKAQKDRIHGRKATGYTLVMNHDTISSYYKELALLMTEEEKEDSIFAVEGFEKALDDEDFIIAMANNSYMVYWFDDKTGAPLMLTTVIVMPDPENDEQELHIATETTLKDFGKKIVIKTPSKAKTMEDALKTLKVTLK